MQPAMLTGLILAGGQARRMQSQGMSAGHIDKGLLDWHGQPLVAHARHALAPHVQTVLISANRHAQQYAAYGHVMADDASLGMDLGPLAGVERALALAQTPWLMVLPVDVVNLPPGLVTQLLAAVNAQTAPVAYACTAERVHPLCMVLHVRLAASLRDYLMAGGRKVLLWQEQHQAVPVLFRGDDLFFNINTPQDLAYASQCWKS